MHKLFVLLALLSYPALSAPANVPQKLPVLPLSIIGERGPEKFSVEIASDSATQARGLMFRKSMAPNAGMLFDFHKPRDVAFWMKNTYIPLDMLFIRNDGTISSIAPNATPLSEQGIPSAEPVRAVLELNGGRAAALGIFPGDKVHAAIFGNAPH